jgi:hypothetical protein
MIKDTTVVNAGRKDIIDLEIKKSYTLSQCNKFMKGTDRADKYLSYYSALRKIVKWQNMPAKLCALQCVFVYKTLNTNKK